MRLSCSFSLCHSQNPWSSFMENYCIHLLEQQKMFVVWVPVSAGTCCTSPTFDFLCCACGVDDTEMHVILNQRLKTGKSKTWNASIMVVAGLYLGGNRLCWMSKGLLHSSAAQNGADRSLSGWLSCKTVELACANSCACKTWLMLFRRLF